MGRIGREGRKARGDKDGKNKKRGRKTRGDKGGKNRKKRGRKVRVVV